MVMKKMMNRVPKFLYRYKCLLNCKKNTRQEFTERVFYLSIDRSMLLC